ncbi:MAG: D-alanine--D-alanine ligase [Bacteroidales bacterium]|nr:D-alanine--D-alanine ligase [Bacteroidales bacterium]
MRKNIAIIAGGDSSEYQISINSAKEITSLLNLEKYNIYTVIIRQGKWIVKQEGIDTPVDKNDFSFQSAREKIIFDVALIAIHGTPGEDGKLQGYFELINIPYTSCDSFTSALTFNKFACKSFLKEFGIPTAKSVFLRKEEAYETSEIIKKLSLPCFVKPNNSGSSFGISKATNEDELRQGISDAFSEDDEVIIESFIEGIEVSSGLLITSKETHIFPLTEIVTKNDFFDYEAKYTEGKSEEITPARINKTMQEKCKKYSAEIYSRLGCRGIVRIDYIISGNIPYFLEINTVPGMSAESIIPKQISAYGYKTGDIFDLVIEEISGSNLH